MIKQQDLKLDAKLVSYEIVGQSNRLIKNLSIIESSK